MLEPPGLLTAVRALADRLTRPLKADSAASTSAGPPQGHHPPGRPVAPSSPPLSHLRCRVPGDHGRGCPAGYAPAYATGHPRRLEPGPAQRYWQPPASYAQPHPARPPAPEAVAVNGIHTGLGGAAARLGSLVRPRDPERGAASGPARRLDPAPRRATGQLRGREQSAKRDRRLGRHGRRVRRLPGAGGMRSSPPWAAARRRARVRRPGRPAASGRSRPRPTCSCRSRRSGRA